jgi:hypothetical protein
MILSNYGNDAVLPVGYHLYMLWMGTGSAPQAQGDLHHFGLKTFRCQRESQLLACALAGSEHTAAEPPIARIS